MNNNLYGIELYDLTGSDKPSSDSPLIYCTGIPHLYLIPCDTTDQSPYNVDIVKLHGLLEKVAQYIYNFLPIGQIQPQSPYTFDLILANTQINPIATQFEQVVPNHWVGMVHRQSMVSRTVGTIYSHTMPRVQVPVFPENFLKRSNQTNAIQDNHRNTATIYRDLATHPKYGKWHIDTYAFNMNKKNVQIIDSTGNLGNMALPVMPNDLIESSDMRDTFKTNRKVYYAAQGGILTDSNCQDHIDDLADQSINQCNATVRIAKRTSSKPRSSKQSDDWFDRRQTIVLRENQEPWFTNSLIVGNASNLADPHKITGAVHLIDTDLTDPDSDQPDELAMPVEPHNPRYNTLSKSDKSTKSIKSGKRKKHAIDSLTDSFDSDTFDQMADSCQYNNLIMYIVCGAVIVLIVCRYNARHTSNI